MGIRILMKNTFLVLKTVNPSEFSLNVGALGVLETTRKELRKRTLTILWLLLFVCLFLFLLGGDFVFA